MQIEPAQQLNRSCSCRLWRSIGVNRYEATPLTGGTTLGSPLHKVRVSSTPNAASTRIAAALRSSTQSPSSVVQPTAATSALSLARGLRDRAPASQSGPGQGSCRLMASIRQRVDFPRLFLSPSNKWASNIFLGGPMCAAVQYRKDAPLGWARARDRIVSKICRRLRSGYPTASLQIWGS